MWGAHAGQESFRDRRDYEGSGRTLMGAGGTFLGFVINLNDSNTEYEFYEVLIVVGNILSILRSSLCSLLGVHRGKGKSWVG